MRIFGDHIGMEIVLPATPPYLLVSSGVVQDGCASFRSRVFPDSPRARDSTQSPFTSRAAERWLSSRHNPVPATPEPPQTGGVQFSGVHIKVRWGHKHPS